MGGNFLHSGSPPPLYPGPEGRSDAMRMCSSVRTHFPPSKLRINDALYTFMGFASVQVQWCRLGAGASVNRSF
jgi:hypothetical protein